MFPLQIDARMLRAVAIEHPKDADEAASVVLSEILPSFPSLSTHSRSSPSVSERQGTSFSPFENNNNLCCCSGSVHSSTPQGFFSHSCLIRYFV